LKIKKRKRKLTQTVKVDKQQLYRNVYYHKHHLWLVCSRSTT